MIQLLRRRLSLKSHRGRDLLVHAGPGAGKTLGALLSFQAMQKEGLLEKFLVFCHRNSILSQWKKSSKMIGLTLKELDNFSDLYEQAHNSDGLIITYQGASLKKEILKNFAEVLSTKDLLAIADEAHHLGVSPNEIEGPIWGETFLELTKNSKIRLGLTGTPFRADNLAFCSARKICIQGKGELIEQITPDLCVEPSELISAGDVRPLEFHFQDGWVEHSHEGEPDREVSPLSTETRETWRARNLRRAIRLSDSSSIALQLILRAQEKLEKVRSSHKNAAGLVIARDIEHAISIANLLKENGENAELVHSQDQDATERLAAFQEAKSTWLVSVDMCSEGFDAPRIRVVAYLSTVVTKSRFLQGITRAVRMSRERTSLEPVPRHPSFIFAPADPLLMDYARNWSKAKPYLIRRNESTSSIESNQSTNQGPVLPLEAVNDGAAEIIKIRPAELPNFLQR